MKMFAKCQKQFGPNEPTMRKVKVHLNNSQVDEAKTSRVRIVASMFSDNTVDIGVMQKISESLSQEDKEAFWSQIWAPEDVEKCITDMLKS